MSIKEGSPGAFLKKISFSARYRKFPLRAMFELTYKCNFRCVHCYNVSDRQKKELTTREIKDILLELKDAGCFYIGFTGGEPFMREDIFEILDFAKINGFRITILTNGSFIDKKTARGISSLGTSLNCVNISVLGATRGTFEAITHKTGSYENVLRAVSLLVDEKVAVQIKSVAMKPNRGEFLMIKRLADAHNVMFSYCAALSPKTNGDREPLKYQMSLSDIRKLEQELSGKGGPERERRPRLNLNAGDIGRKNPFKCQIGVSEAVISPYGEMNLCSEVSYPRYDILRGSVKDGWDKIKAIVRELEFSEDYSCGSCVLSTFCHWCPAMGYALSGSLAKCGKEAMEMALKEARGSVFWDKIQPIWNRQKDKIGFGDDVNKRKRI